MKKQSTALFKIDIDIYPASVIFALGYNNKQINKVLEKKYGIYDTEFIPEDNDGQTGFFRLKGKDTAVIVMEKFKKNPHDISVIAHEALHATNYILGCVGIDLKQDRASDEAFAYLQDYIVRSILEKIW